MNKKYQVNNENNAQIAIKLKKGNYTILCLIKT